MENHLLQGRYLQRTTETQKEILECEWSTRTQNSSTPSLWLAAKNLRIKMHRIVTFSLVLCGCKAYSVAVSEIV